MSARALLPELPGGMEVFRQKHAVRFGGAFAPLKKGVTGWTHWNGQLAECVVFGRTWKIRYLHPAPYLWLEVTIVALTAEDSASSPTGQYEDGDPRFPATIGFHST